MVFMALLLLFLNDNIIQNVMPGKISNNNTYTDSLKFNEQKILIPKCCNVNETVNIDEKTCEKLNGSAEDIAIIKKSYDEMVDPTYEIPFYTFIVSPAKRPKELSKYDDMGLEEFYFSEDGSIYLDDANSYRRWFIIDKNFYCVTYDPETLFISSASLLLVLIVYMLLPRLRNLAGKVLMAYVFNLLCAFLFFAITKIGEYSPDACIRLTTTTYFFALASFCWMNVMSYDIWWTFRGYAKSRRIHRRGEIFKFCMYSIYGWGVPLAMSIALVVIDSINMDHMPWFVKPLIVKKGCFLVDGQLFLYLHVPMLILIVCNWILFLMTGFNIWRLHRGMSMLNCTVSGSPQVHKNQRNRFYLYIKLSVVMGVSWICEVVSSMAPPEFDVLWFITDTYNFLVGVAIFIIFVCKKKIFRELISRFKGIIKCRPSRMKSHKSNTCISTASCSIKDKPVQNLKQPDEINKTDINDDN